MKNVTTPLLAAAIAALVAGAPLAGCKSNKDDHHASATTGDKHACKGMNACKGQGGCATADKHSCKGMNSCKGQGGCKSGNNGCAGKNACKGQGGCAVPKH